MSLSTTSFSYSGTELDALAHARNYYGWIMRHFRPYLGSRVVEVGAGIGTLAERLLSEPAVSEVVLIEPAGNNIPVLSSRFAGDPRVRVVQGYVDRLAQPIVRSADAVVLVNVLEHIDNEAEVLAAVHTALVPGGALLLFVPAMPSIFGSLDEAFGHYRRYTKAVLHERLRGAGFDVVQLRHVNLPGVVMWYLMGRLLRRRTIDQRSVTTYDRWVVPWIERLEQRWEPPAGQSLLAVARVSHSGGTGCVP